MNEVQKAQFSYWRKKGPIFNLCFNLTNKILSKVQIETHVVWNNPFNMVTFRFEDGRDQNIHFEKYYYNKVHMWGDFVVHTNWMQIRNAEMNAILPS